MKEEEEGHRAANKVLDAASGNLLEESLCQGGDEKTYMQNRSAVKTHAGKAL